MIATTLLLWLLAIGYVAVAFLFFLASMIDEREPVDWPGVLISLATSVVWPASMAVSLLAVMSSRSGSRAV